MATPQEILNQKRNQYEPAFHLLEQDFLRVCEFIEPVDVHLQAYSHRLYELLLRASTEFESLSREILEAHGLDRGGNMNVTHFVAIAPILALQRQRAIASFWRPVAVTLAPFEHWTPATVSLPWYQGYNAVKHNRNAEFFHATLGNVRDAICSVFIIMARLGFLEVTGSRMNAPGGAWQGIDRFRDIPFALHYEMVLPGASRREESRRMSTPISVTFDSNVWESIAEPAKLGAHADTAALGEIRQAIEGKRVVPYISDVLVLLESIRKADRGTFFAGIKTTMRRSEDGMSTDSNGVPVFKSTLTIRSVFDHFPQLHEKLSSALAQAFAMGFKMINVPRIGWMRLNEEWYKPQETDQVLLGTRLDRTHHAAAEFEAVGCGAAWANKLGEDAIAKDSQVAARSNRNPFFALAYCGDPAAISDAIAEWADGDALAAHHGHGHDVFCTLDRGRGAGMQSVLHQGRRQWLKDAFGIEILTPAELVGRPNSLISST